MREWEYADSDMLRWHLDLIQEAIDAKLQLRVAHLRPDLHGQLTHRTITPQEMYRRRRRSAMWPTWYVRAFCHERGEDRTFIVDRLLYIEVLTHDEDAQR